MWSAAILIGEILIEVDGRTYRSMGSWESAAEDKMRMMRNLMQTDGKDIPGRGNSMDDVLQPGDNGTETLPKARIWRNQKRGEVKEEMNWGAKQGPFFLY